MNYQDEMRRIQLMAQQMGVKPGMSDPYSQSELIEKAGFDPTGADRRIARMQQYAQQMRGTPVPQGRSVGPSNIYVAPNWGESLQYGVNQAMGGYMQGKANRASEALDDQRNESRQAELQLYQDALDKRIGAEQEKNLLGLTLESMKQSSADTKEDRKGESDLRKEFSGLPHIKEFKEQDAAYSRVLSSAKDASPAGDLALIFNYMKVLDPGSTVREGEFATAQSAARWLQKAEGTGVSVPLPVANAIRMMTSGNRLSDDQRADFVDRSSRLYEGSLRSYEQTAERYNALSEGYGYSPDNVVTVKPTDIGEENSVWLKGLREAAQNVRQFSSAPEGIDQNEWDGWSLEQKRKFMAAGQAQ